MKPSRRIGLVAAALLSLAPLVAAAKLGKADNAKVTFTALGPAGLTIVGKTSEVAVSDDGSNVVVTVTLSNVETGLALRDKHTKNALEVATFPTAELSVPRASLKFPAGNATEADAQGSLTLHGTTKKISFHYTAKPEGDGIIVSGTSTINFKDFGITAPSYLGVTVKNDVSFTAGFRVSGN